jgi:hypothetical protein
MDGDRDEQTTEVRETNERQGNTNVTRQTVTRADSADARVVMRRIIYFIAGVIIAFLVLRIIFLLLAANQGSGFVDFIYAVGGFFASPFYGIFNYTPSYGQFVFEISSVVAIVIYALVAWGLGKLFTLTSNRSDV